MTTYFALTDAGNMVVLGDFPDFDAADNYCYDEGINTIWIFNKITAKEWLLFLAKEMVK